MKKNENKMQEEIENFLKKAFCIKGSVKFDSFVPKTESKDKNLSGNLYEMVDETRGRFYVGLFVDSKNSYP